MATHATHVLPDTPLADIVSSNPRAALIFDELGLDYCCRGHESLATAAGRQGLATHSVIARLDMLGARSDESMDSCWLNLADLVDHIVETHHKYVRDITPVVAGWLDKLVDRHGARHPELEALRRDFAEMSQELMSHLVKEEQILFPYISTLARRTPTDPPMCAPFGSVQNPIRAMEQEHLSAGGALERMRALTKGFAPPEDACMTFRLCYQELDTFERDLHRHVYLENHVLFPRAVKLEQSHA